MKYGRAPKEYRLPDSTHVGQVHLQVSDLQQSLVFYEGLLGFAVMQQSAQRVLLGALGGSRPLIELQPGARGTLRGRHLGLYHFAVLLPDRPALGRILHRLLESGIQPGAADHLVSEALYLKDPDGLGIEIYRDRPRAEWKTRGGEIAMASDPLDVNSVLEAGGGGGWTGMPAGTVVGHLHLHVGELEAAEVYYRALGFDLTVWSYPGALFLAAGGYHHHLGVNTWAGVGARPAASDEPRLVEWELVLPNPEAVAGSVQSLKEHGHAVAAGGPGGSIAIDPWGSAVRLIVA